MTVPFDQDKLDSLMAERGIDVIAATSKHNVRYLLGRYSLFFDRFDAIGVDRFLPVAGYVRNRLDQGFAIASAIDRQQFAAEPSWMPTVVCECETARETAVTLARLLELRDLASGTVAIEKSFIPLRAARLLTRLLPHVRLVEAGPILEEIRAVKTTAELELMRAASEGVLASFDAAVRGTEPGTTTREIANRVAVEVVSRGLNFSYCLIAAGRRLDRTPSNVRWEQGDILSLDSGSDLNGYIGDVCRMVVLGRPSGELDDLLGQVMLVQQEARRVIRAGAPGHEICTAAQTALRSCEQAATMGFVAHGVGLVNHEAPRLMSNAPRHYAARHRNRPLETGMVISLETEFASPEIGLIKLEDTIAVTAEGWEALGDTGSGWTCVEV